MIRYILPFLLVFSAALQAQEVVVVSAASFAADFPVAPESIASAFGTDLAPGSEAATVTPLPTALQGTSVTIIDSAAQSHLCPLFYVSPGQINFLVPPEVALGTATIQVGPAAAALRAPGARQSTQTGELEIAPVSTGLFTVTDLAWMSGFILRVDADGTRTFLPTVELVDGEVFPVPLEMSPGGDETAEFYAILYGTGNRGSGNLATVVTYVGFDEAVGEEDDIIPTLFNGPQGDFVGLDQTNSGPIPRAMEWFGGGDRAFGLEVDGDFSNLAWINVAPNPNAPVISNPSFQLVDGSPPRVVQEFDFEDADGDMGPLSVVWIWEDETQFCFSGLELGEGPFTGQTSGRIQLFDNKDSGTQLGDIVSVSFSVGDAAGHVSNLVEYFPPEGALPGFLENCDLLLDK